MKRIFFVIHFGWMLLFSVFVYGQDQDEETSNTIQTLYTADLDLDGQQDTVIYDAVNKEVIFRLSTRDYTSDNYPLYLENRLPFDSSLDIYDGGFSVHLRRLRSESFEDYLYEKETGKFFLERLEITHCGFGTMLYNGVDRIFSGHWWLHSEQYDRVDLPRVELNLDKPIYWDDKPDIMHLGMQLFEEYSMVYQPEESEVIKFAGTHMSESENDDFLEYFTSDGEIGLYDIIYCNYPILKSGDSIEVTTGTSIFIEPGDGSWHAARGIIEIKLAYPQQRVQIDDVTIEDNVYYYDGRLFTGSIVEYEPYSKRPIIWSVKDGVANGVKTWYFDTGMTKVKEQMQIINGVEHGPYIGYHETGEIMFITTMKKGKEHGTRYCFYKDGTRWHEHPYRKGKQYGMNILYYPETGKLEQKLEFRGFTAHGRFIRYSEEGYKTETGQYKNNKREGTFKTYDERGKVTEVRKYKDGKLQEK